MYKHRWASFSWKWAWWLRTWRRLVGSIRGWPGSQKLFFFKCQDFDFWAGRPAQYGSTHVTHGSMTQTGCNIYIEKWKERILICADIIKIWALCGRFKFLKENNSGNTILILIVIYFFIFDKNRLLNKDSKARDKLNFLKTNYFIRHFFEFWNKQYGFDIMLLIE